MGIRVYLGICGMLDSLNSEDRNMVLPEDHHEWTANHLTEIRSKFSTLLSSVASEIQKAPQEASGILELFTEHGGTSNTEELMRELQALAVEAQSTYESIILPILRCQ